MTAPLSFQQGSPDWHLWRTRALADLYFFADVVLGYGSKVPMSYEEHALMCRFVERKTGNDLIDKAPYQLVLVPREVGKTTIVTQARPIQLLCANPNTSILIANEKEDNAKLMLAEIKRQFESNELLRALFPELIPENFNDTTWSATKIEVKREGRKEPSVFVTGEGGTVTGLHPDHIFPDDILSKEAMENARVGDSSVMGRVNRWVNTLPELLSSNAQPFPSITFVGCVEENQRVLLGDGRWKTIREMQIGDSVASWDAKKRRFVARPVTGVWLQGRHATVTVTTQRHRVVVTATHPFLTDRGYIQASELTLRDHVYTISSLTASQHGRKTMIGDWRQASPDRLWMLGYLWGDGWVTEYIGKTRRRGDSYCICAATGVYADRNARIARLLAKEFKGRIYDSGYGYLRMDNNAAGRVLARLGLKPGVRAPDKRLPEWLWKMRPGEKRAFLRGLLDADGHQSTAKEFRLSTSSAGLAQDVRLLALTCGVRPSNIWSRTREGRAPHSLIPTISEEHVLALSFGPRQEMRRQRVVGVGQGADEMVYDLTVESGQGPDSNFVTEGFVVHNTRWWTGDSYEYVEKTFGHGESRQYLALRAKMADGQTVTAPVTGCYRVGDLAVYVRSGYEDGKVAFPSKWSESRMTKKRFEDPAGFACQVMNNPADDEVAIFKQAWLRYFVWLDPKTVQFTTMGGKKRQLRASDLDVMMFVDPGGFSSSNVEDRARAAIVMTGSTGTGEHLILEAWSEHETFLAAINQVISFASRYGPRKVVVELAGQQAAFIELLRQTAQKAGIVLPLQVERPGLKAKANRILELEPYFQQGHLYVAKSPAMAEFLDQYQRFPRTIRVDVLDALAYGPRFWKREQVGAVNIEERRAKELEAYRARRYGG